MTRIATISSSLFRRGPRFPNVAIAFASTYIMGHQRDDALHIDVALDNVHGFSCVTIGIGDRPTFYSLIVNTGSAITWIGAHTAYHPNSSAFNTGLPLRVTYPANSFAGILFTDTFEITDEYTIEGMAIGVATETRGVPFDGMLGIGPRSLSRGSIPTQPEGMLATVTERLFTDRSISWPLVALFFKPSTADLVDLDDGRLVFGDENPGFDDEYPDFNIGNIGYTPRTASMPASTYWGIDQSIVYGNTEILQFTSGIVDSGVTFISIASDAYDRYKTATGANLDPRNGMLSITRRQYPALRPLEFHIGEQIYNLSPNGQIWPRWLNSRIQGDVNGIYLVIKRLPGPTGSGIDFSLGYVFLQRFYSVYDVLNSRVGFATTPYTDANTN